MAGRKAQTKRDSSDSARVARALERWFARAARDLPWRTAPRDPYRSLVSELMAQQTQIARVVEKFAPFLDRFPTVHDLAAAPEDDVLAAWSGLGYYRRARLLQACARAIVADHAGRVPETMTELKALPGVGDYTAGAIASIVFDRPEPAVDGNVVRVLLRAHNADLPQDAPSTKRWTTDHARALAAAAESPGAVAEALMELGATVCTPAAPRCDACPLADLCAARAAGTTGSIPAPKTRATVRVLHCASVLDADARGRLLVERRPTTGMWAGLWQAPTLESADAEPTADDVRAFAGARTVEPADAFEHKTTHRLVRFRVWRSSGARAGRSRVRRTPAQIAELGISNPQRRILLGD
ncbi:MAG: A/G-specific adenine glycosylase [Phycisphaerales bacterium]